MPGVITDVPRLGPAWCHQFACLRPQSILGVRFRLDGCHDLEIPGFRYAGQRPVSGDGSRGEGRARDQGQGPEEGPGRNDATRKTVHSLDSLRSFLDALIFGRLENERSDEVGLVQSVIRVVPPGSENLTRTKPRVSSNLEAVLAASNAASEAASARAVPSR